MRLFRDLFKLMLEIKNLHFSVNDNVTAACKIAFYIKWRTLYNAVIDILLASGSIFEKRNAYYFWH